MAVDTGGFKFYHYNPSSAAAIIFIVLFIGTTAMHTFQLFKKRTWYFIPFLIGGYFEFIGYIGREVSSTESPNWTLKPYMIQTLLLLLAPALFAASIYMVLGRIILLTDGEEYSVIRARWLTKFFVAGDVISFLAQSAGGGLLAKAKTDSGVKSGQNIITGGLFVQLFFFGFFIVVAGLFHYRISQFPTTQSRTIAVPWRSYMWILYGASLFIMIRSIFRIAEYIQGNDGALLDTEAYLYVFDATLMFLTMVLFNIWHPSAIIPRKGAVLAGEVVDEEVGGQAGYIMHHRGGK